MTVQTNDATPNASGAPELIVRAEALYRAGDYESAGALLVPLAEARPPDPTALRIVGLCRLRQGEMEVALHDLTRAKELAPNDPWADLHLGFGLHAVGRYAEAAVLFRACQSRLFDDPAPSLNLAASLLELGDNREALMAARKAVRRAPKLAQAHYILAMARLACGEIGLAEAAFREALRLKPDFADAWVNLGLIHYRHSDIAAAHDAMTRALAADPRHRGATVNLAVFRRLSGNSAGAEALLREALARDPDAPELRLTMANELIRRERATEALDLLDRPPAPRERRLRNYWEAQRALLLILLGRPAEAREALSRIGGGSPELAPLLLWRRLLLANAEHDAVTARRLAGQIEAALNDGGALVPEHRIMTHFDLARFWMLHGEADRAFPLWIEGHRLLRPFQPFSRSATLRHVDAAKAIFTRARLHDGPRAQNDDPAPVFIVGMPRSGTTLAEQIVASHPQAFGAGERRDLSTAYLRLGGGETPEAVARIEALDQCALDMTAAKYLNELHALAPGARRIVDKMPGNFNYLGLVGLLLPGARIVHCVRDPRDIGLSIFTYRFYGHHPYAHDLGDLGWYIARHDELMAHWREALPNPIFSLHLKDWVEDFAGTLSRLLDFLDLPYDAACERFYEDEREVRTVSRTQVRQPINARGLGRWRRFEGHLQPLFAELGAAGILPAGDAVPAGQASL